MSEGPVATATGGRAGPIHQSEIEAFTRGDVALIAAVTAMWGSSFLLIDIGVDHLAPEMVAMFRVVCGALVLVVIPAARVSVPRSSWPRIAALGITWMAAPMVLFSTAQQAIDSSLAGMMNATAPLWTVVIGVLWLRHRPRASLLGALALGFAGVVMLSSPALGEGGSKAEGVLMVLFASVLYGVSFHLAAGLQRAHGGLPVILRAQAFAVALLAVPAAFAIGDSTFETGSVAAAVVLGVFGTGTAFVAFTTLAGRVGATRASIVTYLLPVVATILGATLRDERIAVLSIAGTAVVLVSAALVGRSQSR